MKIEHRKLADIKPYERNPRINDQAVDAVAQSIREFGFRQPIVVDPEGVIIVGHTRYKAAQKLGLEKVPVHVARGLSPEQIKAYRIADNKTADLAEWDYDLLPLELGELQEADYDLGLLGFDQNDLAKLLDPGVQQGLAVRAIQFSSRTGENVLDLFGGSGSTLIAAEQTGRRAFLMELDAPYCDVIVERWEKFTGKKAERQPAEVTVQ